MINIDKSNNLHTCHINPFEVAFGPFQSLFFGNSGLLIINHLSTIGAGFLNRKTAMDPPNMIIRIRRLQYLELNVVWYSDTVDGRNLAPVDRW